MSIMQNIKVPDIGGHGGVEVIELLVKPGDKIDIETPLITLESDKATMDIPSSAAGIVSSVSVKVGDKISEGDIILVLETDQSANTDSATSTPPVDAPLAVADSKTVHAPQKELSSPTKEPEATGKTASDTSDDVILAGPAVRRLARVLGVNLLDIQGSGRKDRIDREDVEAYVKGLLSNRSGSTTPRAKPIDFSVFGETEVKPLSKIKKLTGLSVQQSWSTVPLVTQFDSADITDLEAFRQTEAPRSEKEGYKLTLLAFVCKAVSQALMKFPQFNSSLDETGEHLIYKKYLNIGIAVETPNGLVVAVIKNVHQLSVAGIAQEMARLSSKARDKGLTPAEMSGGCFTISSLGGIGGHAFTPIVNLPEVAILGLSRSSTQAVYVNHEFVPRLILPLSLSYDHRVIDGAEAARFTRYLSDILGDIRRILL